MDGNYKNILSLSRSHAPAWERDTSEINRYADPFGLKSDTLLELDKLTTNLVRDGILDSQHNHLGEDGRGR